MKKVWVILVLIVGLIVTGIILDHHYEEFNQESIRILKEADQLAAEERYVEAGEKAKEFLELWAEHKEIYSWVAKQSTLSPISTTSAMLIPLLEEENYSEFRSGCRVLLLYIEYLYEQEHLSWEGVL